MFSTCLCTKDIDLCLALHLVENYRTNDLQWKKEIIFHITKTS